MLCFCRNRVNFRRADFLLKMKTYVTLGYTEHKTTVVRTGFEVCHIKVDYFWHHIEMMHSKADIFWHHIEMMHSKSDIFWHHIEIRHIKVDNCYFMSCLRPERVCLRPERVCTWPERSAHDLCSLVPKTIGWLQFSITFSLTHIRYSSFKKNLLVAFYFPKSLLVFCTAANETQLYELVYQFIMCLIQFLGTAHMRIHFCHQHI